MRYNEISELKEEEFRRLTGVQPKTFEEMANILKEADYKNKIKGGRKNKLGIEDQLLLTLEYLREYRTYFHIGKNYGISESSAYKTVKWVEDTLIKHPNFALPGRKDLLKNNKNIILIDATESPVQRPKKNKKIITPERKNDIH